MKRLQLKLIRKTNLLLATLPPAILPYLEYLQQLGAWFAASSVDWSKLPWAFGGATIATLKAKKDQQGNPIHKTFGEWAFIAASGTFVAMAAWKDVQTKINFSPEFSAVIAGLIAWVLIDYIIAEGKKRLSNSDKTPPTPNP